MSRILYITTGRTDLFDSHYHQVLSQAARPGTEVIVRHLEPSSSTASGGRITRVGRTYPPTIPLGQGEMFRQLWEAEAAGFDAAIIGCSADPGLEMAKHTLRIPVTAPLEAGLYLASLVSQRVGVLIPAGFDEADLLYEDLAHRYGVGRRIAAVRFVDVGYAPDDKLNALMKVDPALAREAILDSHRQSLYHEALHEAREMIREHKIGAVYFGCTYWTGMLDPLAQALGVHVLDPGISALRVAEMLADTVRTPSGSALRAGIHA